ncbi:hypothetical protein HPB52_023993 [Rhipicephalus sanguineus]|uniref:Tick transposon n=1 Tax=Rhipicephalus sanguineus TaxID=34632 RepID=A0A9D4Q4M2_RHISA|nr:hypothetical protein HPB52_023993 [Rhipicephalus sanguineus]
MQALLDICAGEGTDLGLIFSARKSAAMRFTPEEAVRDQPFLLQGKEIKCIKSYEGLRVTVTATTKYIYGYEKELRAKALKRRAFLGSRALWAFSRYTAELDMMCPLCQEAEETVRHNGLECTGLRPAIHDAQGSGTSGQNTMGATNGKSAFSRALGFRGSGKPPIWEAVEATKRRLECWWRKEVEQTRAPRR